MKYDEKYYKELEHVLSPDEVSTLFNIPKSTVYRWCADGKLIAEIMGGSRGWIISKSHVEAILGKIKDTSYLGKRE